MTTPDFAADLPGMLAMIEHAVSIDSGTYHTPGVQAVIDLFAAHLADSGFTIEKTRLAGRADQLTAKRVFGNGKRILVLGHADTVWPAGTAAEWPFGNDGVFLTGPGVGDMKTNVVMALTALRTLVAGPLPGIGSITVLIVPDEEIGSPGSRAWIEAHAREADDCLTLEPCRPGGKLVVGRGAVGALYVRAAGVTAHVAAARDLGASAVSALAPMVAALEALTDLSRGVSATIGVFRGGEARQVFPAQAELHLDLRARDQAGADWLVAEATRIASVPPADPRVTITVEGGFYRPPFPTTPGTRRLHDMARAIGGELGIVVDEVVSPGGCDGSFAAALGVPTLDGLGAICHESCSRRERVELASIVPHTRLFAGLIQAIGMEGRS
jgi:glutamate carboxypeptidase